MHRQEEFINRGASGAVGAPKVAGKLPSGRVGEVMSAGTRRAVVEGMTREQRDCARLSRRRRRSRRRKRRRLQPRADSGTRTASPRGASLGSKGSNTNSRKVLSEYELEQQRKQQWRLRQERFRRREQFHQLRCWNSLGILLTRVTSTKEQVLASWGAPEYSRVRALKKRKRELMRDGHNVTVTWGRGPSREGVVVQSAVARSTLRRSSYESYQKYRLRVQGQGPIARATKLGFKFGTVAKRKKVVARPHWNNNPGSGSASGFQHTRRGAEPARGWGAEAARGWGAEAARGRGGEAARGRGAEPARGRGAEPSRRFGDSVRFKRTLEP